MSNFDNSPKKRNPLFKNTIALNVRVLIVAGIGLLTTRLVLARMGAEDYGIFAVVAGFTGMLAFINSALASGTQRHVAYALGAGQINDARKWFSIGFFFHLIFALLLLIIGQTVGPFLLKKFLVIPSSRISAAVLLYQASLITTVLTVATVPFQALFNAYEQMTTVALLSVIQYVLTLAIALLLFLLPWDPLLTYGFGLCTITFIIFFLNWMIAKYKFKICRLDISVLRDKKSVFEMISYSGWNIFGAGAGVARVQGIAVLLNMFFGPVANAAFAVSSQIASQIAFLSQSLLRAINPQIVKAEGSGDRQRLLRLTNLSCKYSFFLLSLIAIPLLLETEFILNIWLKDVPLGAVLFTRLIVTTALIEQLTTGFITAIQAIGKVALYQTIVGSALLLNLLIGFILFKMGFPDFYILITYLIVHICAGFLRLLFMEKLAGMKIKLWFKDVFGKTVIWIIFPLFAGKIILLFPSAWSRFVTTGFFITNLSVLSFFYIATDLEERTRLKLQFKFLQKRSITR